MLWIIQPHFLPVSKPVTTIGHKCFYSPETNWHKTACRHTTQLSKAGDKLPADWPEGREPSPGSHSICGWAWLERAPFGSCQNYGKEYTKLIGMDHMLTFQHIKDAVVFTRADRFWHKTVQGRFSGTKNELLQTHFYAKNSRISLYTWLMEWFCTMCILRFGKE